MRGALALCLVAAGCAGSDPALYIPRSERTLLEAEGRLAGGGRDTASSRPISIDELLNRARTARATAEPLVLRFAAGEARPDATQRAEIARFTEGARAAGAPGVSVVIRRHPEAMGPEALLASRRAVAVARLLEPGFPDAEIRLDPAVRAEEVVLAPAAR